MSEERNSYVEKRISQRINDEDFKKAWEESEPEYKRQLVKYIERIIGVENVQAIQTNQPNDSQDSDREFYEEELIKFYYGMSEKERIENLPKWKDIRRGNEREDQE